MDYFKFKKDYASGIGQYGDASSSAGTGISSAGYGAVASGAISGITQVATSLINAKRIKDTAKFNIGMLELQGRMVRLAANVEIKNIRKKARTIFGMQKAAYAKAGVKFGGSPAAVMANSLKEAELDAIYTDINATYGIGQLDLQGQAVKAEAKQARINEYSTAAQTILNVYSKYQMLKT